MSFLTTTNKMLTLRDVLSLISTSQRVCIWYKKSDTYTLGQHGDFCFIKISEEELNRPVYQVAGYIDTISIYVEEVQHGSI